MLICAAGENFQAINVNFWLLCEPRSENRKATAWRFVFPFPCSPPNVFKLLEANTRIPGDAVLRGNFKQFAFTYTGKLQSMGAFAKLRCVGITTPISVWRGMAMLLFSLVAFSSRSDGIAYC